MNLPNSVISIETSCDETAISVLSCSRHTNGQIKSIEVLSHVVESQTESHLPFGGVVPEVAARDHLSKIYDLAQSAVLSAGIKIEDVDAIAVTLGPGLIGALMVGVLFAQGLALSLDKPLIGVNHVDAHLAPALLLEQFNPKVDCKKHLPVNQIEFPALALTVSGGHCHLSLLKNALEREILGKTADDACGEAFDKVAKLLGLTYPGGPLIEKLALSCKHTNLSFPSTLQDKSNRYGFSFSGLKTAVLEYVRKQTGIKKGKISGASLPDETKNEIAYAFQKAAIGQLEDRVRNAIADYSPKCLLVAGGVAANSYFRQRFSQLAISAHFASLSLCSDNATMIGLHALLCPLSAENKHAFAKYTSQIG